MIRTFLIAAAVLSVGGGAAFAQPARAPVPVIVARPDTPQIARIRAALKGYLRDEKTARIVIVRGARHGSVSAYGNTQTGQLICAQVNARDKYGAYAGFRPYLFVLQDQGGVGVWQYGLLHGSDRVIAAECGAPARR
jgi:hypothetical protein